MPELSEQTIEIAPGYAWHPVPYRAIAAMGPAFRTNYIRAFCTGGTEDQVRALGNELNDGKGHQAWGVRYVYNMLGQWGFPVSHIFGQYRLWAVNDAGELVDAWGHAVD